MSASSNLFPNANFTLTLAFLIVPRRGRDVSGAGEERFG